MRTFKKSAIRRRALANGYRSGLEEANSSLLQTMGLNAKAIFESIKLAYIKKPATYTPDFPLPNGIIIETKGRFTSEDRTKHKLINEQHPELDIRFVFSNPNQRIRKGSNTTYAMWCNKLGFKWAKKEIPQEWVDEPVCQTKLAAIEAAKPTRKKKS